MQPSTKLTPAGAKTLAIESAVIGEIALASRNKRPLRPASWTALATFSATRWAADGTTIETISSELCTSSAIDGIEVTPAFSPRLRLTSPRSLS